MVQKPSKKAPKKKTVKQSTTIRKAQPVKKTTTKTAKKTATPVPTNSPPVAQDDYYDTLHGQTLNVSAPGVLDNDYDPDGDELTVVGWGTPTQGGQLSNTNAHGGFTYQPPTGVPIPLTDSFTYTVSDGLAPVQCTVFIEVTNEDPVVQEDSYSTLHDQSLTVAIPGVLDNDYDPDGDQLTVVQWGTPTQGGQLSNTSPQGGFTYQPPTGVPIPLTDSFTYTVTDGVAQVQGTVYIEVTNEDPVVQDDSYSTLHGQPLTVAIPGVLDNDYDPDGDQLTVVQWGAPTQGGQLSNTSPQGGFTYQPPTGVPIPLTDSFTYTVSDGAAEVQGTVYVEVTNQQPVTNEDFYTVAKNGQLQVSAPGVLDNDYDPDGDSLRVSTWGTPLNGDLTATDDFGGFTYKPKNNFVGIDTFNYYASDGIVAVQGLVIIQVT